MDLITDTALPNGRLIIRMTRLLMRRITTQGCREYLFLTEETPPIRPLLIYLIVLMFDSRTCKSTMTFAMTSFRECECKIFEYICPVKICTPFPPYRRRWG